MAHPNTLPLVNVVVDIRAPSLFYYYFSTTTSNRVMHLGNLLKSVFSEISQAGQVSHQKKAFDWLTYLVYQLEVCFLAGKHLNSCPDMDLRKN